MNIEELNQKCKEKPAELDKLKAWYKGFLFGYAKYVNIEDKGSISEIDSNALSKFDFSLVKKIVENRKNKYLKEISSDSDVAGALLKTQNQREIVADTLLPILEDLEKIIQNG